MAVTATQRAELVRMSVVSSSLPHRQVVQAQALLLAADGVANQEVARRSQVEPGQHLHFTPTSSSWTNLIKRWFKELTDRRLRRGVLTSVNDLEAAIALWADHWNHDPKPFIWKATTEDIITKVRRGRPRSPAAPIQRRTTSEASPRRHSQVDSVSATPRKELVNVQQGDPVVMLHGIGTSPRVWDGWLPALAGRHEIVRPALRGLDGKVTPPVPGTLLDAVVGDVLASIPPDHKAHLVGESTGGTVMLMIALRQPQRVASVTLVNAPLRGGGTTITDRWAALFAEGQETWSAEMMMARFAPGALDPGTWQAFESRQRRTDPTAALALSAMLGDLDPAERLPDLQAGLLALLPTASPFIDPLLYQRLLQRAPDHELHTFHGAQHGLVFSHAAECSAILAEFLHRQEAPGLPASPSTPVSSLEGIEFFP